MRCEFGYCMVCDKEIAKKCGSCDSKKPTQDYTEVQVTWSNGSRMQIALCVDCSMNHKWTTAYAKEEITKAHWDAWDKKGHTYDPGVVIV